MKPVLSSTLRGVLSAAAVLAALLVLFSLISLKCEDPDKPLTLFSYVCLCVPAFIGGFVSSKDSESRALSGAFTGIVLMLAIFLFSLVFSNRTGTSALRMLLTVAFAVVGALTRRSNSEKRSSARTRRNIGKKYGAYR